MLSVHTCVATTKSVFASVWARVVWPLDTRLKRAIWLSAVLNLAWLLVVGAFYGIRPDIFLRIVASGPIPWALGWSLLGPALGLMVHFALTVVIALASFKLSDRRMLLRREWVSAGLFYGVAIWAFMDIIVLPLRWPSFYPVLTPVAIVLQIVGHILFVGLPIAYVAGNRQKFVEK